MSLQVNITTPLALLKALDCAVEAEKAKALAGRVSRSSLARTAILSFLANHEDPRVRATVARVTS